MAMTRAQMISIISNMNDDSLLKALSAVGVDAGEPEIEMEDEQLEGMEPWSAKQVQIDPANKPTLLDKNKFIKQPPVVIRRPAYMPAPAAQEELGDVAPYITPDGMI